MGKKKPFINKKNSATFQLLARDTAVSVSGGGDTTSDRVFVRVDNNPYFVPGLEDDDKISDGENNGEFSRDSIFADAPEDAGEEKDSTFGGGEGLPYHLRKEILELGLPDDGYNYLLHLREIKNSGGGSTYYHNSKAKLDRMPLDVKAFDASRLQISADASGEFNDGSNSFYNVASKAIVVKVQRAVDLDVAKLLDDSDVSRFGSDVEDLDEDFVVKANLPDGEEEEAAEGKGVTSFEMDAFLHEEDKFADADGDVELEVSDKPRVRRLLDEQFDLLTLREYDDNSEDQDSYMGTDNEILAAKMELELRLPGDLEHDHQGPKCDVIEKCLEYVEKYCNVSPDNKEMVLVEESSDEYEVWDCETIVSTYSNLDNHPGKIHAPENPKRRVLKHFPGDSVSMDNLITLRGKQKLPVEFLPHNKRALEKVKEAVNASGAVRQRRRLHGEESKEEKKERKAAVKEERREARRAKKELKELYRCEAQKAQKVAAVAGPSSVHLM